MAYRVAHVKMVDVMDRVAGVLASNTVRVTASVTPANVCGKSWKNATAKTTTASVVHVERIR